MHDFIILFKRFNSRVKNSEGPSNHQKSTSENLSLANAEIASSVLNKAIEEDMNMHDLEGTSTKLTPVEKSQPINPEKLLFEEGFYCVSVSGFKYLLIKMNW